jgi:hypothetical protein
MWNCKTSFVEIFNYVEPDTMEMQLTPETLASWKKDFVKILKEWDKLYVKHIKGAYPDMSKIHDACMKPLGALLESNYNLHNLEEIIKTKSVPNFRFEALEHKFCENLTTICDILRDYGDLKESYNIKQMLSIMKTENWNEIVPFRFYLKPLLDSINKTRKGLLDMNTRGPLQVKYIIENNTEMQDNIREMAKKDITAQWLAGDFLKQDQFKFLYETVKVVYDSPLRDRLIDGKAEINETVIPQLVAMRAMQQILKVTDRMKVDEAKQVEK